MDDPINVSETPAQVPVGVVDAQAKASPTANSNSPDDHERPPAVTVEPNAVFVNGPKAAVGTTDVEQPENMAIEQLPAVVEGLLLSVTAFDRYPAAALTPMANQLP